MSETSLARQVFNHRTMYTCCPRPAHDRAPGLDAEFAEMEKPSKQKLESVKDLPDGRRIKKSAQSSGNSKRKKERGKKTGAWRHSSKSRRLIANARERSRIHIMSEAFECLRRAVPCYSNDQKLSKLAILRLATSYISALADLTDCDTSTKSLKHFADCVDQCTRALQAEGRAKRREGKKYGSEFGEMSP